MAFGLLYLVMALIGKASSDIKYGIVSANDRQNARERGSDTYIDARGITRTVNGNKAVSTYRNDRGEVLLLDKNNKTIKVYNKAKEDNYSIVTARICCDNRGNYLWGDTPGRHKNFNVGSYRYQDIKTGEYLGLRFIKINDKGKKHHFYINPKTLKIIRESDGEIELRNRGFELSPDIQTINEFIIKYNKELDNEYEPRDRGDLAYWDIHLEMIDKMIWEQNKRKENLS